MPRIPIYCSDPLNKHKRKISKNIRKINEDLAAKTSLKLGEYVCSNCFKEVSKHSGVLRDENMDDTNSSSSSSDCTSSRMETDVYKAMEEENPIHKILPLLEESPVKTSGLTQAQKMNKGKQKLIFTTEKLKRSLENIYGADEIQSTSKKTQSEIDDDIVCYQNIMEELKEKFNNPQTSRKLKLQILTLSPYTIEKTSKYFNATSYMVKKSRSLKKNFGILPEVPIMSKGKIVTEEIKNTVRQFYELDENSRQCPGMRDYKTIWEDGVKFRSQKRLILCNLKEMYVNFKKNNPLISLGFSTFASLRPPHCILAGSTGTHSVCVCTYHQNPKLQVAALKIKGLEYKRIMEKSVCANDLENSLCMRHLCQECPKSDGIKNYLQSLEEIKNLEHDHKFNYKQWITVDRCKMVEKEESVDEFIESLSRSLYKLTKHHFISKSQSLYFQKLKLNLPSNEGVLSGDFSENYAFIIQDSVQGQHWENSQLTLHPYVFYYKDVAGKLVHQSYCIISDCLKHSAALVHLFLRNVVPIITAAYQQITKIHHVTDGCVAQYKNKTNFYNLCQFKSDFGVDAVWHFHATSHGKGEVDGIGGTTKRALARASLQRPVEKQIITVKDAFDFLKNEFGSKINYLFVSNTMYMEFEAKFKDRLHQQLQTIKGTRDFHKYIPISNSSLKAYLLSEDNTGEIRCLLPDESFSEYDANSFIDAVTDPEAEQLKIGHFVGCMYDKKFYLGLVESYDEEFDDYVIKFLQPSGVASVYSYPKKDDILPVPRYNIFGRIEATLKGRTRMGYVFPKYDMEVLYNKYLDKM